MSDFTLLVEDLPALQRALQAEGYATHRERDGALIVSCTLQQARAVARAAGVRIRQTWPPAYRLPSAPAGSPPAHTTHKEEQP